MIEEKCKKKNVKWLGDSPDDQERHIQKFPAQSFWHNNRIKEEATQLQINILHQDGNISVDGLCEIVLRKQAINKIAR